MGLIELKAKFDPIIKEYLCRIHDDEIQDHYLGKSIQNELISIMALKVKEVINWIKSKVLCYCTPDVSHQEQFSLTIRFIKIDESP